MTRLSDDGNDRFSRVWIAARVALVSLVSLFGRSKMAILSPSFSTLDRLMYNVGDRQVDAEV